MPPSLGLPSHPISRMRLVTSSTALTHRRENAAETLTDAADELGAESPEQFMRFIEGAVSNPGRLYLLARALTIAQDTAMRDKRRALGRALASAVAETGTTVDDKLAFI